MKFGYYSGCREMLLEKGQEQLIKYIKENGFTHYEPLENTFVGDDLFGGVEGAKAFRDRMDSEGIGCACYSVYIDIYPDTERARRILMNSVDIAAALGSPFMHHTVYTALEMKDGMPTFDELYAAVKPVLTDVIKYASSRGITVLYEPQGMYFNGIPGFPAFFNALRNEDGCESIGICFDFGNSIFVGCQPYSILEGMYPFVRHAHFKDYRFTDAAPASGIYRIRDGRTVEDVPVGTGDMECERCLGFLIDHGYKGVYSTESVPKASGMNAESGGAMAMEYAKKILNA